VSERCDAAAELMGLAGGYQAARVVLAAVEVGVFEALAESPRPADDLAAHLGLQPAATRRLLEALAGLGLLAHEGDRYAVADRFAGCLTPGRPGYIGDILGHHASLWYAWSELPRVLANGGPVPREDRAGTFSEERRTRYFIQGMKNLAEQQSSPLLDRLDLSPVRSLLDLGGGPATYSIAFCRRWPALRATVLDLPESAAWGRRNVAEAGLTDRIGFIEGDFRTDPLGGPYDFILASSIIHSYPPAVNQALFARCAAAMASGGRLAVKEFYVADDRSGPPFNLLFGINMLVNTEGGDVFSRSEVRTWMAAAGLEPLPGEIEIDRRASILIARKP
jgi:SAM-dependent methyltransferase